MGCEYCFTLVSRSCLSCGISGSIDPGATETIKVHAKRSGLWWITRKGEDEEAEDVVDKLDLQPRPAPSRSQSRMWLSRKPSQASIEEEEPAALVRSNSRPQRPPTKSRSGSDFFWMSRKEPEEKEERDDKRVQPRRALTDSNIVSPRVKPMPPVPVRSATDSGESKQLFRQRKMHID